MFRILERITKSHYADFIYLSFDNKLILPAQNDNMYSSDLFLQ